MDLPPSLWNYCAPTYIDELHICEPVPTSFVQCLQIAQPLRITASNITIFGAGRDYSTLARQYKTTPYIIEVANNVNSITIRDISLDGRKTLWSNPYPPSSPDHPTASATKDLKIRANTSVTVSNVKFINSGWNAIEFEGSLNVWDSFFDNGMNCGIGAWGGISGPLAFNISHN